ncbi:DMT family transporter [Segatella bryantii]|uniref:DMT family transporter n=1 Tax=Segatella bryantii TaxID=77095 RepID=UPI0028530F83|nr:DMT family transporter [Segatella bryantii]MDR4931829.1 DMT family transporter [Segatella bryantii]
MTNNKALTAHLSMFGAEVFWGLMAPLAKDAMSHGLDGIDMVSFRVLGGCILFWIASIFAPKENVPWKDKLMFAGAAIFGLVCNQCCYTIGLSITSPMNASIMTTSMPIFAMILSFFILKEPITWKKTVGVILGCSGALILITSSATAVNTKVGDTRGDLLCLAAQLSFALYLALFSPIIKRYSVFTINKWMFLWASFLLLPFTANHVSQIEWSTTPLQTWLEAGYVVFFGTFIGYILTMIGQRVLRPTVVSIYNYIQPIVSVAVSICMGLGLFTIFQGLAIILVFSGVWLVIKSKSKKDIEKAE